MVRYDPLTDVLTIEGVQYFGELFRHLAFPGDGLYRVERTDEVVTMIVDAG